MIIRRTANAGVLLIMNGISVLLDGVSKEVFPYEKTPESIREELISNPPDILAFTHEHEDHYDESFAELYKLETLRSTIGPECSSSLRFGNTLITPVKTRHIGKPDIEHTSFIIQGEKCVWFGGDASPNDLLSKQDLPKPDVMILPFAFASRRHIWEKTLSKGAKAIILVHMPNRNADPYGIWEAVENTVKNDNVLYIPVINDSITLL